MKKYLTIILLVSINFCYGQSDSTGVLDIHKVSEADTIPNNFFMTWDKYNKRNSKIDTVGCFVLYSDKKVVNGTVHSIFAYEVVRSYTTCCNGTYGDSFYQAQDHIKYIDQNKKEFPESFVIWLSKK